MANKITSFCDVKPFPVRASFKWGFRSRSSTLKMITPVVDAAWGNKPKYHILHPRKQTCRLEMMLSWFGSIFQVSIFRCHGSFRGVIVQSIPQSLLSKVYIASGWCFRNQRGCTSSESSPLDIVGFIHFTPKLVFLERIERTTFYQNFETDILSSPPWVKYLGHVDAKNIENIVWQFHRKSVRWAKN